MSGAFSQARYPEQRGMRKHIFTAMGARTVPFRVSIFAIFEVETWSVDRLAQVKRPFLNHGPFAPPN